MSTVVNLLFGTKRSNTVTPDSSIRVQTSLYGAPIPVLWGQNRIAANLIDYTDFKATPVKQGGKGGVFGGGKGGAESYNYSAAVIAGICEGPIDSIIQVWSNQSTPQTLASVSLVEFDGSYTQAPWSYMTSKHPSRARNYRGLAYVAGALNLGGSSVLPNFNYEVKAVISDAISGQPDADPKDVLTDILTNEFYGVAPNSNIGDWSIYSNYCRALGLVISPVCSDSTAASSTFQDILQATNSEMRISSGLMEIVPYGDVDVSGNGASYTAPSAPEYDIVDADFIPDGDNLPIKVTCKRPADFYNVVQINYLDRSNAYNPAVRLEPNEAAITAYGRRPMDAVSWNFICTSTCANMSAALLLAQQIIPNTYTFKVGRRFSRLDCLDIVSLTHAGQGISDQWVRITDIQENSDRTITITADEYLQGTGNAPLFGRQAGSGFAPDYNATPGDTNEPVIFSAPMQISRSGQYEQWLVASGSSALWGGCQVWVSAGAADNYRYAGQITGNGGQGVLSASLATGADPDTVNTLSVDLSLSGYTLLSGDQDDADKYRTLCYVDGELISYETATLTGTNLYNLTYLRRGAYGSPVSAHSSATMFARLDDTGVFPYAYSKDQIGETISVKLLSFNLYGGGLQTLDEVATYSFTLEGPFGPIKPVNFVVTPAQSTSDDGSVHSIVSISFNAPTDPTVTHIEVQYRLVGDTQIYTQSSADVQAGFLAIEQGILAVTPMEFRSRFLNEGGITVGDWTDWQAITTLDSSLPDSVMESIENAVSAVRGFQGQFEGDSEAGINALIASVNQGQQTSLTAAYGFNTLQAQIVQGISASALAIETIGAVLNNGIQSVQAQITEEELVRADETGALAEQTTNINTTLTGFDPSNTVQAAMLAQSVQLTSLSSTLIGFDPGSTVQASMTVLNETVAGYSPSSTIAAAISTLSTTVGGHTTSITSLLSTQGGTAAYWGIAINSDDAMTGLISLTGNGSTSAFVVDVSSFELFLSGGNVAAFVVSGGTIYLNVPLQAGVISASNIVANTITASQISIGGVTTSSLATEAATLHNSDTWTGTVSTNDTNWNTLKQIVYTSEGNPLEVDVAMVVTNGDNGGHNFNARLVYNTVVQTPGITRFPVNASADATMSFKWILTPSSGTCEITIQWQNNVATTVLSSTGMITTDEIKR